MASAGAGRSILLLVLLLAVAGGAGAWNYQRNLAKEEAIPRPWRGYATEDLSVMEKAYREQIDQYSKSWDSARGERNAASGRGHVDDRAREFAQIYAKGQQVRQLKSELAESEVVLAQIQEELRIRAGQGDAMQVHLHRLLTFD